MDLVCTFFTITFYPAPYPSEEDPLVLLAEGASIDAGSPIVADLEQIVEEVNYVRGVTPDFFNRGGRKLRLQWDEVRKFDSPGAALAESFDRKKAMPQLTGWAAIEIPSITRTWAISPVAFRADRTGYDLPSKTYRLSWELLTGALTEIFDAPPGAIAAETGRAFGTEDGDYYFILETD